MGSSGWISASLLGGLDGCRLLKAIPMAPVTRRMSTKNPTILVGELRALLPKIFIPSIVLSLVGMGLCSQEKVMCICLLDFLLRLFYDTHYGANTYYS